MPYAIIAYNNTIHSSTNFTPYELVLGHTDSRDPMNLIPSHVYTEYIHNHKNNTQILYDKITEHTKKSKQKTIDKINQDKTYKDPKIGSQVYKKSDGRSSKIKKKFLGPFILTKILENNKIEIENPKTKRKEIIHINESKIMPLVPDGAGSTQAQ